MNKPYFILAVRWQDGGKWFAEFGDYSKSVVEQERRDMLDGYDAPKARNAKVVRAANGSQAAYNAAMDALNA